MAAVMPPARITAWPALSAAAAASSRNTERWAGAGGRGVGWLLAGWQLLKALQSIASTLHAGREHAGAARKRAADAVHPGALRAAGPHLVLAQ